jgi:hypothetical protein
MWKSSTAVAHRSCESLDHRLVTLIHYLRHSLITRSSCQRHNFVPHTVDDDYRLFLLDTFLFLAERINSSVTQLIVIFYQSDMILVWPIVLEGRPMSQLAQRVAVFGHFIRDIRGVV